jgi:hypothetical protein
MSNFNSRDLKNLDRPTPYVRMSKCRAAVRKYGRYEHLHLQVQERNYQCIDWLNTNKHRNDIMDRQ